VVLYTGALLKSKGIDYLWQAIPHVLKKNPEVYFVIVGYPVEESQKTVAALGVAQRCIFVGQVDFFKLPAYLFLADLAVDPKLDEAGEASGKIINYMGAGLPSPVSKVRITGNFWGPRHLCPLRGRAGPGRADPQTLADPEKAREIGEHNRKRVEDVFSWNANIMTYDLVFRKALNRDQG